jgi:hypothetical protein
MVQPQPCFFQCECGKAGVNNIICPQSEKKSESFLKI